jgi:hypothetical protein
MILETVAQLGHDERSLGYFCIISQSLSLLEKIAARVLAAYTQLPTP